MLAAAQSAVGQALPWALLQVACVPGCVQLLGLVLAPAGAQHGPTDAQRLQPVAQALPAGSTARVEANAAASAGLSAGCQAYSSSSSGSAAIAAGGLAIGCVWPASLASGSTQPQQLAVMLERSKAEPAASGSIRLMVFQGLCTAAGGSGQPRVLADADVALPAEAHCCVRCAVISYEVASSVLWRVVLPSAVPGAWLSSGAVALSWRISLITTKCG